MSWSNLNWLWLGLLEISLILLFRLHQFFHNTVKEWELKLLDEKWLKMSLRWTLGLFLQINQGVSPKVEKGALQCSPKPCIMSNSRATFRVALRHSLGALQCYICGHSSTSQHWHQFCLYNSNVGKTFGYRVWDF